MASMFAVKCIVAPRYGGTRLFSASSSGISGAKLRGSSRPLDLAARFHRVPVIMTLSPKAKMASEESSQNVLEWVQNDKPRFLHAAYRVGNLERTIKFYTECFGMKLLRQRGIPEEKYSNAFLGFGPEESHFVLELTYNYGVDKYDIGTGFGHFSIATEDVALFWYGWGEALVSMRAGCWVRYAH